MIAEIVHPLEAMRAANHPSAGVSVVITTAETGKQAFSCVCML
jgi:hypothetical protein